MNRCFFRFLEYYAQVKVASLKRTVIAKMAFEKLSSYELFVDYVEFGHTLENLYSFYCKFKSHDILTEVDLLKLQSHLDKTVFVHPEVNIKTWIETNRSKLSKKQINILVELWDKRFP